MKTVDQVLGQYHYVTVPTRDLIAAEAKRYAPGHEETFVNAFISLQKAMALGDIIFHFQYDPVSSDITAALQEMQRLGAPCFDRFLDAARIAGSRYDPFTKEKIEPNFSREDLRRGYDLLVAD